MLLWFPMSEGTTERARTQNPRVGRPWLPWILGASVAVAASAAHASVSVAVSFDDLVKGADAVAVVTPLDGRAVWEDGRIVTYTHVRIDEEVAGSAGKEAWVRTLGGVVDSIGQSVDGEPAWIPGQATVVFLRHRANASAWNVNARAQGQYSLAAVEASGLKLTPPSRPGLLLRPSFPTVTTVPEAKPRLANAIRLASEVLANRPYEDARQEIALTWRRLHAPATQPR